MLRKIKKCPLVAITRAGNTISFNHDVIVKGVISVELSVESVVEISIEFFKKGIDIISVTIDESKMDNVETEVL